MAGRNQRSLRTNPRCPLPDAAGHTFRVVNGRGRRRRRRRRRRRWGRGVVPLSLSLSSAETRLRPTQYLRAEHRNSSLRTHFPYTHTYTRGDTHTHTHTHSETLNRPQRLQSSQCPSRNCVVYLLCKYLP